MSSSPYDPDEDALPSDFDSTRILSQRDLSSTIPINFVTVPGVSLTSACFPYKRYDTGSATRCVSNLLGAGFRRLEVDIFWDVSRTSWSFCPVQLGEVEPQLSVTQDSTTTQVPSSGARKKLRTLSSEDHGAEPNSPNLRPRQTTTGTTSATGRSASLSLSSRSSMPVSTPPSATTTRTAVLPDSSSPAATADTPPESTGAPDDQTMLKVGAYECSTQLDFHLFLEVLDGHFASTEDNVNATTIYLTLNIHAAASALSSNGANASPSDGNLPQGINLLSSLISSNSSSYLYTPQLLGDQRADLNKAGSWFTVRQPLFPDFSFYQVDRSNNVASTPDGWPSEGVVELARARRMLAGFGTIDPAMKNYDFASDASTIFSPGYLQEPRPVRFTSDGNLTSGCILSRDGVSIAQANSSWATAEISADDSSADITQSIRLAQASNLTDCGISPILNTTLSNSTADKTPLAYKAFAMNTIWSWAENEPQDGDASEDPDDQDFTNRCAALNATSSRWQAHSCDTPHHAACRVENGSPYDFRISDSSAAYDKAENACRGDVQFAVSRTALENSFLSHEWRSYRADNDVDDELLWVDFNDLDIEGCWVIGQNSTCPYQPAQVGEGREIVVPTVAAVVVFVLAILTIFIKCAANRRNTRRRRKRMDDGWDYEGVPS